MKRSQCDVPEPPVVRLLLSYLSIIALAGTLSLLQIAIHDGAHVRFLAMVHSIGSAITPDFATNNVSFEFSLDSCCATKQSLAQIPSIFLAASTSTILHHPTYSASSTFRDCAVHSAIADTVSSLQTSAHSAALPTRFHALSTTRFAVSSVSAYRHDININLNIEQPLTVSQTCTHNHSEFSYSSMAVAVTVLQWSLFVITLVVPCIQKRIRCLLCSLIALYAILRGNLCVADYMELGPYSSCALLTSQNNAVKCFGYGLYGQLGYGVKELDRGDAAYEMGIHLPAINFGTGFQPKFLSPSLGLHRCVISQANETKCFGLGFNLTRPQRLNLSDDFVAIKVVCGYKHTCALSAANSVTCLGAGNKGSPVFDPVSLGDDFVAIGIGTGYHHTCVWSITGTAMCFGSNQQGQLGQGDTENRPSLDNVTAIDLGSDFFVVQVCGGFYHTCALSSAGAVKCFGGDASNLGVLGLSDLLQAVDLGHNFTATAICCGAYHNCALSSTHSIKCWGHAGYGQLGYGEEVYRGIAADTMGDFLDEVDVGSDFIPKEVKCGGYHTCTTSTDDKMKCYGYNYRGQLGYEDRNDRGDQLGEMGDDLPVINLLDFTLQPTSDPTVAPTRPPTQSPSAAPSSPPTPSPTAAPTVPPTQSPTAKPSVSPTKSPTSGHPTSSPTLNPISIPSTAPTQSPTYCNRAKFLSWMNADDYLWADEALISANCLCQLVMQSNGDLLLQHRAKRSSAFITAWHSNTSIGNYSGESVPRLEIKDDARLVITEYPFKWATNVGKRPVWQNSNAQQTPSPATLQSVKLYLSDSGCLQLLDDEDSADILHLTVWYVCADRSELYPDETSTSTTTNSDDDAEAVSGTETGSASRGREDPLEDPWWIWLILSMVVLSAMGVLVFCRQLNKAEKMAVSANNAFDDHDDSGDEEQDVTDVQMKAWMQETELVAVDAKNEGRTANADETYDGQ